MHPSRTTALRATSLRLANMDSIKVKHDATKASFVAPFHDAELNYFVRNGQLHILHTYVPEFWRGMGVASALVGAAIAYAEEHNLEIDPVCPFADWYINERNVE